MSNNPPIRTLKDFNHALESLGLPAVNPQENAALTAQSSREDVLNLLSQAQNGDERAKGKLGAMIRRAQGKQSDEAPASNEAPASGNGAQGGSSGAARSNSEDTPSPSNTDEDGKKASLHAYGTKAALTFETDESRAGMPTIFIDAAASVGERKYDWSNKLRLQLTRQELPVVAAVFLGILPKCEFKNHGEGKDKGFSIENQGKAFFIRVFAKGKNFPVPVDPIDAFYIASLVLHQLRAAMPVPMEMNDLILLIRSIVKMKAQPKVDA